VRRADWLGANAKPTFEANEFCLLDSGEIAHAFAEWLAKQPIATGPLAPCSC
jgi:hypothetical protein